MDKLFGVKLYKMPMYHMKKSASWDGLFLKLGYISELSESFSSTELIAVFRGFVGSYEYHTAVGVCAED